MISEEMKTTIRTLYEKGYNKSQISRMLQIDRKTVRAKLKESDEGLPKKKIRPTILNPYKEYIKIEANKGIQAKRIYHDLIRDYDYKGSYDTVKKYIHSIKENNSKVYMVLNNYLTPSYFGYKKTAVKCSMFYNSLFQSVFDFWIKLSKKIVAKLQKKVNDFAVKSGSKNIRGLGILPYGNLRVVTVA